MPTKQTMKPLHLFVPITRTQRTDDGNALFLEGYAYVNAIVGDGWNLKRSSMEAATPDYMSWGAVREMHQPSAVGTATGVAIIAGVEIPLGVEWDEKGAYLRTLVVDVPAIDKCERGVYKGFSVGVQPTKVRGIDVEECVWIENSLVDRPFDKDAPFSRMLLARRDGAPEDGSDVEVEVYADGELLPVEVQESLELVVRGMFQQCVDKRENSRLRSLAWDVLYDILYTIVHDPNVSDVEKTTREAITEFADYIVPLVVSVRQKSDAVAAAEMPEELYYAAGMNASENLVTRVADITRAEIAGRAELARVLAERDAVVAERDGVVERATTLEANVATLTAKIGEKDAEITRLNKNPDPAQPKPVRANGGVALEREFTANPIGQPAVDVEAVAEVQNLRDELKRLTADLPGLDEKERQNGISRMLVIKQQLANRGETV